MQSVGAAMNVAYLENLSTTTMIDPNTSTLGKAEIKSMEMLSQGLPGIGLVGVPTGLLVSGGLPCLVGKQGRFLRTPLPLLSYGAKSLLLRVGLRYAAALGVLPTSCHGILLSILFLDCPTLVHKVFLP